MAEEETITEVGNVRIIDDGYDDEDVFIEINDERIDQGVIRLENIEMIAPEMADDFQEAVEIARDWYDNGRTHNSHNTVINFESVDNNIATLPLTADYNIESVDDSFTNEYVVYFDENDLLSDVITNLTNNDDDTDFGRCWYFSEAEIQES